MQVLRKLAVIGVPYTGLQTFLTTLERDGHRFKPTAHVLNTGLPLTKPKTLAKWNFIAEHCQKRLPAGDRVRKADICGPPTFCELVVDSLVRENFDIQQSDWFLTIAKLP